MKATKTGSGQTDATSTSRPPPGQLFRCFLCTDAANHPNCTAQDGVRIRIAVCNHAYHITCLENRFKGGKPYCIKCRTEFPDIGDLFLSSRSAPRVQNVDHLDEKLKIEERQIRSFTCPLCLLYKMDPSPTDYLLKTPCCEQIYHHFCILRHLGDEREHCVTCCEKIIQDQLKKISPPHDTNTGHHPITNEESCLSTLLASGGDGDG